MKLRAMKTEHMDMIKHCEKHGNKLTRWEVGFINSVVKQNLLSDDQLEVLKRILERVA